MQGSGGPSLKPNALLGAGHGIPWSFSQGTLLPALGCYSRGGGLALGMGVRWLWKLGREEFWGKADIGRVNAASLGVLKASFLRAGVGDKGKETKTPAGLSLYLGDQPFRFPWELQGIQGCRWSV